MLKYILGDFLVSTLSFLLLGWLWLASLVALALSMIYPGFQPLHILLVDWLGSTRLAWGCSWSLCVHMFLRIWTNTIKGKVPRQHCLVNIRYGINGFWDQLADGVHGAGDVLGGVQALEWEHWGVWGIREYFECAGESKHLWSLFFVFETIKFDNLPADIFYYFITIRWAI